MHEDTFSIITRRSAVAAAPLAIVSVGLIIAAEASGTMGSMAGPLPIAAGAVGLAATCALLLALVGVHLTTRHTMGGRGGAAMAVALVGAGLVVGAAWSTAIVAPAFDASFPGLLTEPLTAVVAGYVASHAVLGLGTLVWAVIARRTGAVTPRTGTVLIVGGLLCITPLPARFILIAIGLALAVRQSAPGAQAAVSSEVRPSVTA